MILIIDHYDSFVHNIEDYIKKLGYKTKIEFYDKIDVKEISNISHIILSPGPKHPKDANETINILNNFPNIPTLGICLGNQIIAYSFGAKIIKTYPTHGKSDKIYHNEKDIFENIKSPFNAARYHSLSVDKNNLPTDLEITAYNKDDIIMGIKHKQYPLYGVQFHPESILSDNGIELLKNFLIL